MPQLAGRRAVPHRHVAEVQALGMAELSNSPSTPVPLPQHISKYVEREIVNHMKLHHPHVIALREVRAVLRCVLVGPDGPRLAARSLPVGPISRCSAAPPAFPSYRQPAGGCGRGVRALGYVLQASRGRMLVCL